MRSVDTDHTGWKPIDTECVIFYIIYIWENTILASESRMCEIQLFHISSSPDIPKTYTWSNRYIYP